MFLEYLNVLIFLFILIIISLVLFFLNYSLVYQQIYLEKISAYECGFQPFEHSISDFDIRYYLIAILFLIFDLELIFLIPFLVSIDNISFYGIWSMILFIFLLVIGFYYEWLKKGLE